MQQFSKYLMVLLSAGLLTACQKDYSPYEVPEDQKQIINDAQGEVKCLINGENFKSEFQSAYVTTVEGTSFKVLNITGIKYGDERITENANTLTLTVGVYEGPKWYNVNYPASATLVYTHKDNGTTIHNSTISDEEQFLEITEDNGKFIKGKFKVKLTTLGMPAGEFVDISEGEFNVPIINR